MFEVMQRQKNIKTRWRGSLACLYFLASLMAMGSVTLTVVSALASQEQLHASDSGNELLSELLDEIASLSATDLNVNASHEAQAESACPSCYLDLIDAKTIYAKANIIGRHTVDNVDSVRLIFKSAHAHPEIHYQLVRNFLEKHTNNQSRLDVFLDFYQRYDQYSRVEKDFNRNLVLSHITNKVRASLERQRAQNDFKRFVFGQELYDKVYAEEFNITEINTEIGMLIEAVSQKNMKSKDLEVLLEKIKQSPVTVKGNHRVKGALRNLELWLSYRE